MHRTTIVLPDDLKSHLMKLAKRENLSFGELVRQALMKYLSAHQSLSEKDPFFSSKTIFDDEGPTDISENHDLYLNQVFHSSHSK